MPDIEVWNALIAPLSRLISSINTQQLALNDEAESKNITLWGDPPTPQAIAGYDDLALEILRAGELEKIPLNAESALTIDRLPKAETGGYLLRCPLSLEKIKECNLEPSLRQRGVFSADNVPRNDKRHASALAELAEKNSTRPAVLKAFNAYHGMANEQAISAAL